MNVEEKISWIENILNDFREGHASPEEVEKLRALMLEDSEARRIYLESNQLTILLESTSSLAIQSPDRASSSIARWTIGLGIAAALALGIWFSFQPSKPAPTHQEEAPFLATLSSSNEAKWDGLNAVSGKFHPGKFKLLSGVAELEFQNGAQIIVEGPCAFEIVNDHKIELAYGKLWGHCPPTARGFEILAPGGNRIVDLGTEFGIDAAPSGELEVHVFDGEVEVFSETQEKQALKAGSAIQMSLGEKSSSLSANFEGFTSSAKLQNELYQRHHSALLERDDLLLYYDFSSLSSNPSHLHDLGSSQSHGKIKGALPVIGRTTKKGALLFEKNTDTLSINLNRVVFEDGFTLAMWIKPADLNKSSMALLNSDGFAPGNIHFQITDDGRLMSAIAGVNRFASPRNVVQENVWQHVAVRWNLQKQKAQLFVNGLPIESIEKQFSSTTSNPKVSFRRCRIGSWGKRTYGHNRNFVGRIDEVTLFSSPLSESEMAQLFEASRP